MILCDITINWTQVLLVLGIFSAIGIVFTAAILIVAKVCKTNADEKIENILSNLAGANCGGCGCSGCEGFAKKLCGGEAKLDECHVTENDKKVVIAKILGIDYVEGEHTVMVVRCAGGRFAADSFRYNGLVDCANEELLFHGAKICKDGCLGSASCIGCCPEKAIVLDAGHAYVKPNECISCGVCADTCPKSLFERIPMTARVYIACSSKCKGKEVIDMCKNGCIGCGLCARACPEGAITMNGPLPVIDYSVCTGCEMCVEKCPRKVIKSRKNVFLRAVRRKRFSR